MDNILPRFMILIQIYIPAISIPKDSILKKKNDIISLMITFLSIDLEANTNILLVKKANNTDKNQAIKLFR